MRVLFTSIFSFLILYTTVSSQSFTVSDVTFIQSINTNHDDFAPRINNNQLEWIENQGNIIRKKSTIMPVGSSKVSVISEGSFLEIYPSYDIYARPLQTEEYLSMQLFQRSNNSDESLPLFPEMIYCSQPSVSPSGNVLYFSGRSDENSLTTDIFVSLKLNGKWQSPVVLSSKINSTFNEITPFALSDDTVIFASNGLGGKGGYDLFVVSKDGADWNDPVPLNDLNSSGNDSDPFVAQNGTIYFASDRKGVTSGYDIYSAIIQTQNSELKETFTYFPKGIEVLRSSTEELLTIPTIIPIPWLETIPSESTIEYSLYDEWRKTIGLIGFHQNNQHILLNAHIPSSLGATPKIVTKVRELLKNSTPIINQNSELFTNGIVLTTDQIQQCKPIKISNTTQKLLTPQLTVFWNKNDFSAVQWEVHLASSSVNLLSLQGKCLPEEQSLQFSIDTVVKMLSNDDNVLHCTVYLINAQSEVLEQTFSIPIISTTIAKTGKSNSLWNNFYVYFGDDVAKRAVYSLYTQSIMEANISKELKIEYSKEYEKDALLFRQLLEVNGKKVTTSVRTSQFVKESGASILESTMMTVSFPR